MEGHSDTHPEEIVAVEDTRLEAHQGLRSDHKGLVDPVDQEVQDSHPDTRLDIRQEDLQEVEAAKVTKDATIRKVDDINVATSPIRSIKRVTDSSARTEAEAEVVNATAVTPGAQAVAASEEAREVPTLATRQELQAVDRPVHAEE